jgi:hypothetical protein
MSHMNYYLRNRQCYCARCRCRGLTGAAILITLGVLMMLDQFHVVSFHITAPVVLIVWGVCLLLSRTSSTEGHVQPFGIGGPGSPPPSSSQDPWAGGRVSPPPTAPPTSASAGQQPQDDQQVKP